MIVLGLVWDGLKENTPAHWSGSTGESVELTLVRHAACPWSLSPGVYAANLPLDNTSSIA